MRDQIHDGIFLLLTGLKTGLLRVLNRTAGRRGGEGSWPTEPAKENVTPHRRDAEVKHPAADSQDWAGLEVLLIHPLRLAYFQDLCVTQVLQATLELVQRIRLEGERSHDLLPHHLHYLPRRRTTTGSRHRGCMWTAPAKTHYCPPLLPPPPA